MAQSSTVMLRVILKVILIFCIKGPLFNTNSVCYSFAGVEEINGINVEPKLVYESLFTLMENRNLCLKPQLALQLLLLLSGDIEKCPGPRDFGDFTTTRGMKIVHQNIRGLWQNLANLSVVLERYRGIDIITLSETHITHNPEEG